MRRRRQFNKPQATRVLPSLRWRFSFASPRAREPRLPIWAGCRRLRIVPWNSRRTSGRSSRSPANPVTARKKQKSGYRLDSKAGALKGGETYSPAIKPGDSVGSPLIHLVAGLVPDSRMPAKGDPLTPEQIGLLRAWIDQGAVWSGEGRVEVDPIKSHWAFQAVKRPSVPALANHKSQVGSPSTPSSPQGSPKRNSRLPPRPTASHSSAGCTL